MTLFRNAKVWPSQSSKAEAFPSIHCTTIGYGYLPLPMKKHPRNVSITMKKGFVCCWPTTLMSDLTTAAIFWALPVKTTSIYWLLRAIKTEDKRKRGHLKSTWGRTVEAELQACKGPTQLTLVDALCANWRLFKGTDNYTFNLLHYRKIFQQKIMFEWVDINVFFFNFSGWHHQVINLVSLMKFALS